MDGTEVAKEGIKAVEGMLNGSNEVLNGKNPVFFMFFIVVIVFALLFGVLFVGFGLMSYNNIISYKDISNQVQKTNDKLNSIQDSVRKIIFRDPVDDKIKGLND